MSENKVINFHGVELVVNSRGIIYRAAHTTVSKNGKHRTYAARALKPNWDRRTGYCRIGVRIDGKLYNPMVHRLVAEAFLGEPLPGQVVNHINECKIDNRAENLEWVTQKENIAHSLTRHPSYRLNGARRVRQSDDNGAIAEYDSAKAAERATGICQSGICQACRGILKTFHGFKWAYII